MPISMKINQDNVSKELEPEFKKPEYPPGLRIFLNKDDLKRLMMDTPDVGKELDLVARVKVVAVSEDDLKGGGEDQSVTLQITDMNLSRDKDSEGKLDVMKFYGD